MAIHLTPEANPTVQEGTLYVDSATGEFNVAGRTVPHIIPGVLYPAVAGKLLDGSTSHGTGTYGGSAVSTDYGTTQSDGRMYYRTDIKGSKPIKDPRIGGHFGSQRHRIKSLQLLEQETATEGKEVKCADGREWIRFVDGNWSWHVDYDGNGHYIAAYSDCTNNWFEITGYFNDINFLIVTDPSRATNIDVSVNGTLMVDNSTTLGGVTSVANPLHSRYVDAGSMINGGSLTANGAGQSGTLASNLGTTPKINTIKFLITSGSSKTFYIQAIELIAQDTSNRNNIQIPSQNVVSYGKKFTVSGTPHYDPFNGFVDDTTLFSAKVDTATSLGLGTATTWGASWDTGSDNHIRPFNGGRVIKWVDSDGTIKTSVTMMPRNAQNTGTTDSNEITDVSSTNSHTINFSDDAVEHSLSEVAKTFHFREFGNGSANGNASYSDPSTLVRTGGTHNTAFVMDDGLTSLCCFNMYDYADYGLRRNDAGDVYFTFVGTGLTITGKTYTHTTIAQNLPYGTHVFRQLANGSSGNSDGGDWFIDGVKVRTLAGSGGAVNEIGNYGILEFTIHQPKKPPIPEDACVLADYMLMADFVPQTSAGIDKISKGTRSVSASRDFFINDAGSNDLSLDLSVTHKNGFKISSGYSSDTDETITFRLPSFGTNYVSRGYQHDTRKLLYLDATPKDSDSTKDNTATEGSYAHLTANLDLGVYEFGTNIVSGQYPIFEGFDIVTPIHTSSHYQSFETPYLHELVGGDRNMEQTNLVCSPDGKSWDELTRDTSYIGNHLLNTVCDNASTDNNEINIFDNWRGQANSAGTNTVKPNWNKDFAIAYDRVICLKGGSYHIMARTYESDGHASTILINGVVTGEHFTQASSAASHLFIYLKRGDYVQIRGQLHVGGMEYNQFAIIRI